MFRTDLESSADKSKVGHLVFRPKTIRQSLTALLAILMATTQSLSINPKVQANPEPDKQRSAFLLDVNAEAQKARQPKAKEEPNITTTEAKELIKEVSQRLLAVVDVRANKYIKQYSWPPTFHFLDSNVLNAYASIVYQSEATPIKCPVDGKSVCPDHILRKGKDAYGKVLILPIDRKINKFFPHVAVYKPLMIDLAEGDRDRLAFILGHEIAHILLGHILPTSLARIAKTQALKTIFTAEQEHDADVLGMDLALKAGYSIKGARELWLRLSSDEFLKKYPGFHYSSFEGTGYDHRAWTDRLQPIDKNKRSLWKAMSAFENGVFFAQVQQYAAAEACFEQVVKEFPAIYEAWANLGYTRLMLYFDAFDRDDLANFDVGQIEVGSFYVRPETLRQQVRGIDKRVWEKTIEALQKAIELKPDLTLAKTNLALAYLMSPTGKNTNKASQYMEDAVSLSKTDKDITEFNRAVLLSNSAVVLIADGQADKANARLQESQAIKHLHSIDYNYALLLSYSNDSTNRHNALSLMESYLNKVSPDLIWWGLGYDLYAKLSKELGLNAKSEIELKRNAEALLRLRPCTSVEIKGGLLITVSDSIDVVKRKIGSGSVSPVVVGTKLVKLAYPQHGIELLTTNRVLAIILRRGNSPHIQVRAYGTGSKISLLRVGMPLREIRDLLGHSERITLNDPLVAYDFYPHVGVAVRSNGNKVSELILTEIVVKKS